MTLTLEQQIIQFRTEANRGCGLVYELFVERFSSQLDRAFPPGHPDRALAIELAQGDYCSAEELEQSRQESMDDGYCAHGLDPNCCPAGCGDLDY